jgi:hypothetical protein
MFAANGFGTCITLGVNERQMRELVEKAKLYGDMAGICHDPTYPMPDGAAFHHVPIDTCGYIFGYKETLAPLLGNLKLMP